MNKIMREDYPVANLPEDLQREFEDFETVRIIPQARRLERPSSLAELERRRDEAARGMAASPFDIRALRGKVTIEEAVARIRTLRDEWDDE